MQLGPRSLSCSCNRYYIHYIMYYLSTKKYEQVVCRYSIVDVNETQTQTSEGKNWILDTFPLQYLRDILLTSSSSHYNFTIITACSTSFKHTEVVALMLRREFPEAGVNVSISKFLKGGVVSIYHTLSNVFREALDPVPPPSRDFPTLSAGTFRCCWLFFRQGMGHGKHPALHTED